MKAKFTCLFLAVGAIQFIFGQNQVFLSENFNSLTPGQLGTQNAWATFQGSPTDYSIVAIDAAHINSLTVTSGAGAANTDVRYAYKGFDSSTILSTNNFMKAQVEIYTGSGVTGLIQSQLWSTTTNVVGISYNSQTQRVEALSRLTQISTGASGFYRIPLGTQTYPPNTWINTNYTYNKTTGSCTWTYAGNSYSFSNAAYSPTTNAALVEHDFIVYGVTGNTVANTGGFDNLVVLATNTLATTEVVSEAKLAIRVFPNPTTDFINVDSDSKISKIRVFDSTGKEIILNAVDNKVDVRKLSTGTYIMSIETNEGLFSDKFIKK